MYAAASSELRVRAITTQVVAANFWTSDATIAHTGAIYAWEFVSKTTAAVSSITITVPSAVDSSTTGLYVVSAVHLTGIGTPTLSGSTLTYTLAAPVAVPAG